jgi:hypothetical protein
VEDLKITTELNRVLTVRSFVTSKGPAVNMTTSHPDEPPGRNASLLAEEAKRLHTWLTEYLSSKESTHAGN